MFANVLLMDPDNTISAKPRLSPDSLLRWDRHVWTCSRPPGNISVLKHAPTSELTLEIGMERRNTESTTKQAFWRANRVQYVGNKFGDCKHLACRTCLGIICMSKPKQTTIRLPPCVSYQMFQDGSFQSVTLFACCLSPEDKMRDIYLVSCK